jgi:hypothetical protein
VGFALVHTRVDRADGFAARVASHAVALGSGSAAGTRSKTQTTLRPPPWLVDRLRSARGGAYNFFAAIFAAIFVAVYTLFMVRELAAASIGMIAACGGAGGVLGGVVADRSARRSVSPLLEPFSRRSRYSAPDCGP